MTTAAQLKMYGHNQPLFDRCRRPPPHCTSHSTTRPSYQHLSLYTSLCSLYPRANFNTAKFHFPSLDCTVLCYTFLCLHMLCVAKIHKHYTLPLIALLALHPIKFKGGSLFHQSTHAYLHTGRHAADRPSLFDKRHSDRFEPTFIPHSHQQKWISETAAAASVPLAA